MEDTIKTLIAALEAAQAHLEYCGYGDSWERECSEGLDDKIQNALNAGYVFFPAAVETPPVTEFQCPHCNSTKIFYSISSLNGHMKQSAKCKALKIKKELA